MQTKGKPHLIPCPSATTPPRPSRPTPCRTAPPDALVAERAKTTRHFIKNNQPTQTNFRLPNRRTE
ncbi:MAG: hypothetical protein IPM82_30990 [Saprospiraceae bacterium]|nr:hypothetical protein [Saprospiraceae bacterium]